MDAVDALVLHVGLIVGLFTLGFCLSKRCPQCHTRLSRWAPRCYACGRQTRTLVTGILLSMGLLSTAYAADVTYLDCRGTSFFRDGCVEVIVEPPAAPVSPEAPPPVLFQKGEMAPDTPALLIEAFNDPTPEKIDAYLAWQTQRQSRIQQVQQLLIQRSHAQLPK